VSGVAARAIEGPSIEARLDAIRGAGRYRRLRTITTAAGPRVRLDGRDVLLLCSNNYLGLADDPRVVAAAKQALDRYGAGAGASRLVSGNTDLHEALEGELAALKGTEGAVLYPSGYQANLGAVPALVGPGDLVASDRLNHASLIDACRLSGATVRVFDHGDASEAGRILREQGPSHRASLVLTDGVFSMDGDLAPLAALRDACSDAGATLMVDDAHGTGVLGPDGAGTARHLGVADAGLQMGTLSKALASQGGFVAAGAGTVDLLRNTSRPFIFSTAPAPACIGAARAALEVARREPERRTRLLENARRLRAGLQQMGLRVPDGTTPIIPVVVGLEEPAMAFMRALEAHGVFAAAIRPPTVPAGSCRIRATVMATHTRQDIDEALQAFEAAARQAKVA
jgi:8-amino-7-oxononanoate synthase